MRAARFLGALIALLVLVAPACGMAHTLFVVLPNGDKIPIFLAQSPLQLRALQMPNALGYYQTWSFSSEDPDCTATLSLAQTAGPPGIVTFTPAPPATPVFNYAFDVNLVQPIAAPTAVTVQLTWVGSGGPGQICGTQTETNTIQLLFLPPAGSSANVPGGTTAGDPINTGTGELTEEHGPHLVLGSTPFGLQLGFLYAAHLGLDGNIAAPQGALGPNWLHQFDWRLVRRTTSIEVITNRGRVVVFEPEVGGGFSLVGPSETPFQLASEGANFVFLDPLDDLVYTFDSLGRLTRVEDGRGNRHDLTYVGNLLSQVSDGLGRTLAFSYTAGRLTSVSDGTRTISFAYTGNTLTSFTDARGNTRTFSYAASAAPALLAQDTLPQGNVPFSQTFDAQARADTQSDADADTWQIAYDGLVTNVTDPLGNLDVHTYEAPARIIRWTDAVGNDTSLTYNASGQRTSLTDRLGDTTLFSYHSPSGKLATITNADGGVISHQYSPRVFRGVAFSDLASISWPDGTTESFSRDTSGNVTTYTDQASSQWRQTFNSRAQPTSFTNPLGGVTTITYNPNGTLATRTDPAGNVTSFTHDALFRLISVNHPDGTTHAFSYDANDHVVAFTDGNGFTSSIGYDANDNRISTTDQLGHQTVLGYDTQDRLVSQTDPLGQVVRFTYDPEGRDATYSDRRGNVTSYAYDTLGRLASFTDAAGHTFRYSYNAEGVLTEFTNPLGAVRRFESDEMGRFTRMTTALGFDTQVTNDNMSRLVALTNALGETTTLGYDARGMATSHTLGDGASASYVRDALGQIVRTVDPNGNAWPRGRDNQGRQTSQTDPLGNLWIFAYNNRNRVSDVTLPLGTLELSYDGQGRVTRKLYSDGTDLNITHDPVGRVTGANALTIVHDARGSIVGSNGIAITRDAGGRIATLTLAPGRTITYGYDVRNLLAQITDWTGAVTTFSYDAARRLTQITRPNGITTVLGYDADDRLVSITDGGLASTVLSRDAQGQVASATRNVPTPAALSSPTAQVLAYDAAFQIAGASYDAMGRLTGDARRTYTWDLASRLTSYEEGGVLTRASYDGLGFRTSRTRAGTTRSYVWNWGTFLPSVGIEREGGADLRYYVTMPDGMIVYSMDAATGSRLDYHYDELGNTLFLSDADGQVAARYAYAPHGERLGMSGAVDNPFTWQGGQGVIDEGNGLYYMRSRYYDSRTGRYISRDPVNSAEPHQINPYQYALNNPLRFTDPMGLEATFGPIPFTTEAGQGFGLGLGIGGTVVRMYGQFRMDEFNTAIRVILEHGDDLVRNSPATYLSRVVDALEDSSYVARYLRSLPYDLTTTAGQRLAGREGLRRTVGWVAWGTQRIDELSAGARAASRWKQAGTALAAAGVAIDAGVTIYDGVCHGDSAGIITYDTGVTIGVDTLVLAAGASAPPILILDAVTLGGVSGTMKNAFTGAQGACDIFLSDQWSAADTAALERRMTRTPVTKGLWRLGELYAEGLDYVGAIDGWAYLLTEVLPVF
jgi:RHS repeat-associated protein